MYLKAHHSCVVVEMRRVPDLNHFSLARTAAHAPGSFPRLLSFSRRKVLRIPRQPARNFPCFRRSLRLSNYPPASFWFVSFVIYDAFRGFPNPLPGTHVYHFYGFSSVSSKAYLCHSVSSFVYTECFVDSGIIDHETTAYKIEIRKCKMPIKFLFLIFELCLRKYSISHSLLLWS